MIEELMEPSPTFDCREAFAAALEALAREDDRLVTVVNDSVGSSKLSEFRKRWPERTINVGIAEQTMVGVAAGLANAGKVPFVSGASCFLTGRALEQIKADVAYSNANVKLCGMSSGVAYGELGPTHHSIEDIAWLRPLPNLTNSRPRRPLGDEAGGAFRRPAYRSRVHQGEPHARAGAAWGRREIRTRQGNDPA